MKLLQLKNQIIRRLAHIDDEDSLRKILNLIQSIKIEEDFEQASFLNDNKIDEHNDKEDFNEYIKEWIKRM